MKLIALVAIAAGMLGGDSPAFAAGDVFEAADDIGTALIGTGEARADDPSISPPAPVAPPPKAKQVKVRVLVDCPLGRINDVVTISAEEARAAATAGVADSAKEAVAYALTLAQNQ